MIPEEDMAQKMPKNVIFPKKSEKHGNTGTIGGQNFSKQKNTGLIIFTKERFPH